MIAQLRGKLISKSPTEAVVDVHGVGYQVNISISTSEKLPFPENEVNLLTYLHIREDAMQLFGFLTEGERELFKALISVSGIGPKLAQNILSGLSPADLREAITGGNIFALTSISGVGKKTAERILLELRTKVGKLEYTEAVTAPASSLQLKARSEALVALMSLGHSRAAAEQALRAVLTDPKSKDLPVEELIRRALHQANKK